MRPKKETAIVSELRAGRTFWFQLDVFWVPVRNARIESQYQNIVKLIQQVPQRALFSIGMAGKIIDEDYYYLTMSTFPKAIVLDPTITITICYIVFPCYQCSKKYSITHDIDVIFRGVIILTKRRLVLKAKQSSAAAHLCSYHHNIIILCKFQFLLLLVWRN